MNANEMGTKTNRSWLAVTVVKLASGITCMCKGHWPWGSLLWTYLVDLPPGKVSFQRLTRDRHLATSLTTVTASQQASKPASEAFWLPDCFYFTTARLGGAVISAL